MFLNLGSVLFDVNLRCKPITF